jgi:2-oxoglutarate/2-oxoacid ferredoxin oxidoreductase subunit beta
MPAQDLQLTAKDFVPSQEVKWCPGCGDYSILKQVQAVFPELGIPREKFVFISGIGCSSRFTYYMDTYGMHSIHGRAAAIAEGVKVANPDLSVWVVSGDGDALSIGGNHFIHFLRKNFDIKMLVFNNQIYSLTKGQYSPTSERGKVTKTTPYGSLEEPFNPVELALGAKGTFVARTLDRDPKHMREILRRAHEHRGGAFIEIYQNCPVFNDEAFFAYSEKETRKKESLILHHGKPLIYGDNEEWGIMFDGLQPVIVNIKSDSFSASNLWVHDEHDKTKANLLARFSEFTHQHLPRPFGVLYSEQRPLYEEELQRQAEAIRSAKGRQPLSAILSGAKTWQIN